MHIGMLKDSVGSENIANDVNEIDVRKEMIV